MNGKLPPRSRKNLLDIWLIMAVCLGLVSSGCRTAEKTMLCVSRLKSPLTLTTPALSKPFTAQELEQAQIDPQTLKPIEPCAEACADLHQKDTLVVVCLSGGGARAARMAAHTLASLEQRYNLGCPRGEENALAGRIDAWSTVSGGSVYSSFVAMQMLQDKGPRTNTFAQLAGRGRPRWGTQRLGGMAALYYLWPGNLGYAPLMQFFTDWDTLDLFAHTLALGHEGGLPMLPVPRMTKLGDLPARPRFFFNATCREASRPFIFTQSVVHRDLSGDPLARLGRDPLLRWIEGESASSLELDEPFRHALTLEDIGSPPNRFPLAYAAMASAAFPGVFEPLLLPRYWLCTNCPTASPKSRKRWWLRSEVTLADGGLYDNTGLTTALEYFEHLRQSPTGPKKLILLAIDANNELDGYNGARKPSSFPWHFGLPFRGAATAVSTMGKMYQSQQTLVSAAINRRIQALQKEGCLDLYPVRLKDALKLIPTAKDLSVKAKLRRMKTRAAREPWSQIQSLSFFGIVQDIPTDFVLSNTEDEDLKGIVERLLDCREKPDGPSLAERFVRAVGTGAAGCGTNTSLAGIRAP